MAGARSQINVEQVNKSLAQMARRFQNLFPVWQDFGEHMIRSVHRNFREGGRPDRWEPSKSARREGRKTLIKDSNLMNSVTWQATGQSVIIGTNLIYAAMHQFGGPKKDITITAPVGSAIPIMTDEGLIFRKSATIKAGSIPKREFLLAQDEDIDYLERSLMDHILGN